MRVKGFLTAAEVARRLHLSRPTVYRMLRNGHIGHTRIGSGEGRMLIPKEEIDRLTEEFRTEAMRGSCRAAQSQSAGAGAIHVYVHASDGFTGAVRVHLRVYDDGRVSLIP